MNDRPRASAEWWRRFHDLMPYRVREILLVSSPYDFYILEEDGCLSDRLFTEYSELNLPSAPRITHAASGADALRMLQERRFDLVITMVRLGDMDITAFGQSVKAVIPDMPVVLLTFSEAELSHASRGVDPAAVELVFLWTGDSRILLAIIKQVEDRKNVEHDIRVGDVRVMVVVEDSISRYSAFLSVLYAELMSQSNSLVAEGLNELHKLFRMRARPKLLLACNFEDAVRTYEKYRDNVVAVITDIRFPRNGAEDPKAGIDLVRIIREHDNELPIVLQSAERSDANLAAQLKVFYFNKNANVLRQVQQFLVRNLGFGEFIFRLPGGTEIARVKSMYEMEQALHTIPAASLEYHASRNHISLWLMARCMFEIGKEVHPWEIEAMGGIEELRKSLIRVFRGARLQEQDGIITNFTPSKMDADRFFIRLGTGSIGGKARGIAFVNSVLARERLAERFPGLDIRIPRSVVISTDHFDAFMEENGLHEFVGRVRDDKEILRKFLKCKLSPRFLNNLELIHQGMQNPLAIRSSSLLEDSHAHPFAGIYSTYMLPNNHADQKARFDQLCLAIKAVYASTYCMNGRSYIASTTYTIEEEKMGVVIQEVVGRAHNDRFYPNISGVAMSYNYYPIGYQKADEGLAVVALGLGQIVVQQGVGLRFSPSTPGILPQFGSNRDWLRYAQTKFFGLDMSRASVDFQSSSCDSSLREFNLDDAELDETLVSVASTYLAGEDRIRDSLTHDGPRVVTFNNILKWKAIPLAEALEELLRVFRKAMGCAVEIEFAVDMGDYGRSTPRGQARIPPRLYLLQIRPQSEQSLHEVVQPEITPPEQVLCSTNRSLGHGVIDSIADIVYVKRRDLDHTESPLIANRIGDINARLREEERPYMLIGPGRWGSSDPGLGIPVSWSQICGARVIIETTSQSRSADPSQGTHFFQNITSFKIGYLTLSDASDGDGLTSFLDWDWMARQTVVEETEEVRHVRFDHPIKVYLDGHEGAAMIAKPQQVPDP